MGGWVGGSGFPPWQWVAPMAGSGFSAMVLAFRQVTCPRVPSTPCSDPGFIIYILRRAHWPELGDLSLSAEKKKEHVCVRVLLASGGEADFTLTSP